MMGAPNKQEYDVTAFASSGLLRRARVPGATRKDLRCFLDNVDGLSDASWRELSLLVEETARDKLAGVLAETIRQRNAGAQRRVMEVSQRHRRNCMECGRGISYQCALRDDTTGQWMCQACAEEATRP